MLDHQVSEFEKQQLIESQEADKLADLKKDLAKLKADEMTIKGQIAATLSLIENKRLQVLNVQSDPAKGITEKASELLQLEKEIELHQSELRNFDRVLEAVQSQLPEIEDLILRLSASLVRREKEQRVRQALEEFLPAQEAFLEARKRLYLIWQANGEPFGWAFVNAPVLTREGQSYQNFRGVTE